MTNGNRGGCSPSHNFVPQSSKVSPNHYGVGETQLITLTEQLNFNRGNVLKYVFRAGAKDGESTLDDLQKALWYLNREITRVTREEGQ